MVSTRKKRQSNRRLLSQLDAFDQDMISGKAVSERQENTVVNEGTNDRDFTVSTSNNDSVINGNAKGMKTLERCFNETIDREMSNIVDTVEDRIQNAILTAIENIVAPKIELAIRSINASSGRDATSVSANSERRERVGVNASFENASRNNDTLDVSNVNDETRHNIPDEVNELSVPVTHFDRQPQIHHMVTGAKEQIHNHHDMVARGSEEFRNGHHKMTGSSSPDHHMVTGQTAQPNQFIEFLTGCIVTPRNPPSHQYQNLSTQVSQDNNLPVVEQTQRKQNSDANNSINRLADAIAGIATQQRPQAAKMLKPVSTSTLIFDGKNEKLELFEDLFHTMLKMQPEMTEAMKINHFHTHLRKEALQIFRNISASNKKTLGDVLIVFQRKFVKPETQATAKYKWHKITFDPNTKSLPDFLKELNECAERESGDNAQHLIDSLLNAKLPLHLKRSLNLAYLESGTYDQLVAHLERELELSGLENHGELTIPTMTAVTPNDNQQNTEKAKILCHYCKKPGHFIRDCRKRMRKEQEQRNDPSIQNTKPSLSKSYAHCLRCQRTNHPPEKCWSGPISTNRPKRFKQEYSADNRKNGQDQGNLNHSEPSKILKNSSN